MESPVPVVTGGEGYPLAEGQRCQVQRHYASNVLGVISITVCSIALLYRICSVSQKKFKFPGNAFIIALASLVIYHSTLLINIANGNSHLRAETLPQKVICQMQAVLMHWSIGTLVWNAIYVTIVLYLLVVRHIPLPALAQYSRFYYCVVFGIPTLAVLACAFIGRGYAPADDDDMCWINPSTDRLAFNTSFMVLGMLIFFGISPSLLMALRRAYRAVGEPIRARVFRSMMIRLMCIAVYALINFGTNVLVSGTLMIYRSNHESTYARATVFSYCIARSYLLASMGLILAVIFSIKKRRIQQVVAFLRRLKETWQRRQRHPDELGNGVPVGGNQKDRSVYVRVVSESDLERVYPSERRSPIRNVTSPRSPAGGRQQFPSAACSDGQTAVSIPPDPCHNRAHLIASQAYTTYVLENAREQLVSQDSFGSDSDSSSLDTLDSLLASTDLSGNSQTSFRSSSPPQRRESGNLFGDEDGKDITEL